MRYGSALRPSTAELRRTVGGRWQCDDSQPKLSARHLYGILGHRPRHCTAVVHQGWLYLSNARPRRSMAEHDAIVPLLCHDTSTPYGSGLWHD